MEPCCAVLWGRCDCSGAMTLSFGTLNIPVGAARVDAILAFILSHDLDILALQELDLSEVSRTRFREFWKMKGFHVALGASNPVDKLGNTLVALISRIPLREICPSNIGDSHRACFGLVEVRFGADIRKLLLGSVYGHSTNFADRARALLCEQVVDFVGSFGLPWIVLGDWNTDVSSQELAPFVAQGCCFSFG